MVSWSQKKCDHPDTGRTTYPCQSCGRLECKVPLHGHRHHGVHGAGQGDVGDGDQVGGAHEDGLGLEMERKRRLLRGTATVLTVLQTTKPQVLNARVLLWDTMRYSYSLPPYYD